MTNRLIALSHIPYEARREEADARRSLRAENADVLAAARYQIHDAAGCYGGAWPSVHGYVVTRRAADALAGGIVRMPGGTQHHDTAWSLV